MTSTLGERIQELRRRQGLSQEGLGDALGVSRQAISKWESDAAIPEVDKLVAMSRLFATPVGVLLGVEEAGGEAAELTDRELALAESIAAKYIETLAEKREPEPPPKKKHRLLWLAAALAVVIAGGTIWRTITNMEREIRGLRGTLDYVQRDMARQSGIIASQVESILREQSNFTEEYTVELTEADLAAGRVTLEMSAIPKSYEEGMHAVFTAECDGESIERDGGEGPAFAATLDCPLRDDLTVTVTFVTGTRHDRQKIGAFYGLYTSSIPRCFPEPYHVGLREQNGMWKAGTIWIVEHDGFAASGYAVHEKVSVAEVKDVRLGLFAGHDLAVWMKRLEEKPENYHGDYGDSIFFELEEDFAFEPGKEYCLAAVVTDEYGREIVCMGGEPQTYLSSGEWSSPSEYTVESDPDAWNY